MDNQIINNIKALGIDMIREAESGHPGIVLGAAPILYTLYAKHMHVCENDPNFINRDRFILSAGHGSALLYATLYMAGLGYNIADLKKFRQLTSITTGHPEYGVSPFVEATTGPLGQGIAMAVGMALGEKILEDKYNLENEKLFDYYVYALCGDGDLMEGISTEAASFAGTHNLNNLIVLYDANKISLDGKINHTFTEDIMKKFEACNWNTLEVIGDDVVEIDNAICSAKKALKPTIIKCNTTIGKGSSLEGTNKVHGKPLTEEDIKSIKEKLHICNSPFFVDEKAREDFRLQIKNRSEDKYHLFHRKYKKYIESNPSAARELQSLMKNEPILLDVSSFSLPKENEATRVTNGKIMNMIAKNNSLFIGGSADLSSSTMTYLNDKKDICKENYDGSNIWFGVREHAMGAILNGLALTNFRAFGSTFLVFSDYIKPAMRLSALMDIPAYYIFTHDSIEVGEDGPTHEPVEQLAAIRAIPNLNLFRPCDAKEILGVWKYVLSSHHPFAMALSRGKVPQLNHSKIENVKYGAYIIKNEQKSLSGTIIASGTEVSKALEVAEMLYKDKQIDLRVVSMPCLELFKQMDESYQKAVLGLKDIFVLEAGSSLGLEGLASSKHHLITIDSFGKSGKKEDVMKSFNFTTEQIKEKIEKMYEVSI